MMAWECRIVAMRMLPVVFMSSALVLRGDRFECLAALSL
jgi:hypothetical protein